MKLFSLARHYRSGKRLRQILTVLARHGFGHVIERMNLAEHVPLLGRILRREQRTEGRSIAMRLVDALQELGPTFVKFGQMLSGRPDLLSEEYIVELKKLRDRVEPFDSEQARLIVTTELGAPISELFSEFSNVPLASGSIAQVHEAVMKDGQVVVVKVKRPGIERIIMTDIELLTNLAELLKRHVPELEAFRPALLVDEFQRGIRRELDFITEAGYTAKFARIHADNDGILIPEVCWELTTSSVLTMSRLEGVPLTNTDQLRRRGIDLVKLAGIGVDVFMKQFFDAGMFHADPHGGNLLVTDDNRLGMIDFGLVGHLSDELRGQLATSLLALAYGDTSLMVEVYSEIGVFSEVDELEPLKADLKELIERYYGLPLKYINSRKLFLEAMELARRYHVVIPREFVMLARSFASVDALGRELDPNFDVTKIVEPYARKLIKEKLSPQRLIRSAGINLWQVARLLEHAPRTLRRLSERLLSGKLSVELKHKGLGDFTLELEKSSNRLAFSIILAAIIVGSSLILFSGIGPTWQGISLLGIAGYAFAAFLGLWLVIAILRSGRM